MFLSFPRTNIATDHVSDQGSQAVFNFLGELLKQKTGHDSGPKGQLAASATKG